MHHDLKLQRKYWEAKVLHMKPWEIRETTDRHFAVHDTVTFIQVSDDWDRKPTGLKYGPCRIIYLLTPTDANIIPDLTCIFTHTQA